MLLKTDDDSPQSCEEKSEAFHALAMKGVLLVKRARLDLEPGLALLDAIVRALV